VQYEMFYYEYNHGTQELTLLTSGNRAGGRLDVGDYNANDWRSRSQMREGQESCFELNPGNTNIRSGTIYTFIDFADASEIEGNFLNVLIFDEQEEGTLSQARVSVVPITVSTNTEGLEPYDFCDTEAAVITTYTASISPSPGFDPTVAGVIDVVPVIV
jgi:hypothetical protein